MTRGCDQVSVGRAGGAGAPGGCRPRRCAATNKLLVRDTLEGEVTLPIWLDAGSGALRGPLIATILATRNGFSPGIPSLKAAERRPRDPDRGHER
jgi:hypothetical protein